jgi:hypothetical protein
MRFYELGEADRERWTRVADPLAARRTKALPALELAKRPVDRDPPVTRSLTAGQ